MLNAPKTGDCPSVTVLMSVYNGEAFLRDAIQSILWQTFTDFEFLIINDGSIDGSKDILVSQEDRRVVVYHQPNMGLVESLNRGLALAKGNYIARMDADDVSLPDRLERQVRVLEDNQNILLVGSFWHLIDASGRIMGSQTPHVDPVYRRWRLTFQNNYIHGGVMFRKTDILKAGAYKKEFPYAEDYELWLRVSTAANSVVIPAPLYQYRRGHGSVSVSTRHYELQTSVAASISDLYIQQYNPTISNAVCAELRSIYWPREEAPLTLAALRAVVPTVKGFCCVHSLTQRQTSELMARVVLDTLASVAKTRTTTNDTRFAMILQVIRNALQVRPLREFVRQIHGLLKHRLLSRVQCN